MSRVNLKEPIAIMTKPNIAMGAGRQLNMAAVSKIKSLMMIPDYVVVRAGGMPPRKILKNRCPKIESEGYFESCYIAILCISYS